MTLRHLVFALVLGSLAGCDASLEPPVVRPPPPPNDGIFAFANGCYSIDATAPGSSDTRWLEPTASGAGFAFTARDLESGSRFFLKASDLGTYLFYDAERQYLVNEDGPLVRLPELKSDLSTIDDTYISGGEWELQVSANDTERFQLVNRKSGNFLTRAGSLTPDVGSAAVIALYPQTGCAEHPELTVDATGTVVPSTFPDGALYGIVDTHAHMMANFGFGGGGITHGAPFHRLGVQHALPDCKLFHGTDGRRDLLGYAFDQGISGELDVDALLPTLLSGRTPGFNHNTAGYPDFTDWPAAPFSSTHQAEYYRWLERAYLAGLRLVVQHATTNSVLCELFTGQNVQRVRYSCNEMVAVDRSITETFNLERYIDAQSGGPGRGWFRVVRTPAEARAVIASGKLAVILGIEMSNLFDCFSVPHPGFPTCDAARVATQVQRYYDLGVRAMFPVHKHDNAFSAGDGHRPISEIGNFINSGQWSSYTEDCPDLPTVFDSGTLQLGGLNMPRPVYDSAPPNDMSGFAEAPVATLVPYLDQISAPSLVGDYCQSHGLTALGETLIHEMMIRGMILEVDHMPQRSYARAFEILEANNYPAAGTHGNTNNGRIYDLGGISKGGLGRCEDPARPGAMGDGLTNGVAEIVAHGGYPARGFGFDLNGFAGAPGPRFGPRNGCGTTPQTNPINYPFDSYDGTVTFTEPHLGNRTVDFNTEGMSHIGLMPELIEDARRTGVSDATLEPLFRSAEGYIRMWELAETRAATLR